MTSATDCLLPATAAIRPASRRTASLPGDGQSPPEPIRGHARIWRESVMEQLRAHDDRALVRTVAFAADVLSPDELPWSCWIPCLIGMEEARCSGQPFACASNLARFIAISARVALTPFPVRAHATWLVGASMLEQSAAHLIALLHARRGSYARPWWAPGLPRRGSYLMVSVLAPAETAGDGKRCLGSRSLAEEAL